MSAADRPPGSGGAPETAIAQAAAQWYIRLQDKPSPAAQAACAAWRAADARHEAAWQKAQTVARRFAALPTDLAWPVLGRPRAPSRRTALKALALGLTAPPAFWWAAESAPVRAWAAQYRTGVGERRHLVLADGLRVALNTDSALDVDPAGVPRLLLRAGEIFISVAADGAAAAQLHAVQVETAQGRIAGAARELAFSVRLHDGRTQVSAESGRLTLHPLAANAPGFTLAAGQHTHFDTRAVATPTLADPAATAWREGRLFARNQRLDDFVAELGRYRQGYLHCDPAIASLRLSGAFDLQDTDAILASLPELLPVQLVWRTRYWVSLAAA